MSFPVNKPVLGDTNWGSLVNENWTTIDNEAERTVKKNTANGYLGLNGSSDAVVPDLCTAEAYTLLSESGTQRISFQGPATSTAGLHVLSFTIASGSDVTSFGHSSTNYLPTGAVKWIDNDIAFIYFNSTRKFRIGCGLGSTTYSEFTSSALNVGSALSMNVLSDVQSTSPTTGSACIAGGVGISKDLCIDGGSGKTLRFESAAASGSVATTLGSAGPTDSTAGDPQGWMRVSIAGTDRYIPFW